MEVLKKVSEETDCELYEIPQLKSYDWGNFPPLAIGLYGAIHNRNASVALQLARYFYDTEKQRNSNNKSNGTDNFKTTSTLRSSVLKIAKPFKLDKEEALGLRLCKWPGRAQIVTKGKYLSYFLDGAHTLLSVQACRSWFEYVSNLQEETIRPSKTEKILIFNTTRDRPPKPLLSYFSTYPFDKVIFTTNLTKHHSSNDTDNTNHTTSTSWQSKRCEEHKSAWEELQNDKLANNAFVESTTPHVSANNSASRVPYFIPCYTASNINEAIECATSPLLNNGDSVERTLVQVLVTGSIHLVGGVLQIIDPDIFNRVEDDEEIRISEQYQSFSAQ